MILTDADQVTLDQHTWMDDENGDQVCTECGLSYTFCLPNAYRGTVGCSSVVRGDM